MFKRVCVAALATLAVAATCGVAQARTISSGRLGCELKSYYDIDIGTRVDTNLVVFNTSGRLIPSDAVFDIVVTAPAVSPHQASVRNRTDVLPGGQADLNDPFNLRGLPVGSRVPCRASAHWERVDPRTIYTPRF